MRHFGILAGAVSVAAVAIAAPASAQEISSAIAGQITSDAGKPLAAARVVVVHVPSGTRATTTTDSSGNYALRGLRIGGPYTVVVEATGFASETVNDIALQVGDTYGLPVRMSTREIVVSATSTKSNRSLDAGSSSTFRAADIALVVSAKRDVRDIMRRDILTGYNPNAGGVSIAGANIRTQRFSVDGVATQDSFGLNYGGLPSTRGIVSLEMIDQLTVKAAPFDVSEGNFQGGAVNVVLKSGTNKFHGSAFGSWGGPSLTGKRTADTYFLAGAVAPVGDTKILDFTNWGVSLSGPIIKNKLFFAVAYERLTEGLPFNYGPQGTAAPNLVPNLFYSDQTESGTLISGGYPFGGALGSTYVAPISGTAYPTTLAGLNSVYSTFKNVYGNWPIGDVPTAISETDKKLTGKLDWNIAEGQRFSLSYIGHENVLPGWGTSGGGSSSTTSPYIQTLSDLYKLTEHTDAFSAQLNSKWSDNLSSEVRLSYKYYRRGQDSYNGTDFAQFNVCLDPTSNAVGASFSSINGSCSTGTPSVRLGPDTARQANQFHNRIYNLQTNASYRTGDHTIKIELDHMYSTLYNLFVYGTSGTSGTGGGQGLYYFDSMADFGAAKANEMVLYLPSTGSKNDGYVNWGYHISTLGVQDTWKAAPNLTVNYGYRYDLYSADNTIQANSYFTARYASLYPGMTNTATLDGRSKFQPRVGFNWAPKRNLKVSGGFGLFAGGVSDVFMSNNYSNSGAPLGTTGATLLGVDLVRTATGCYDNANKVTPTAAVCNAALNGVTGSSIPGVVVDYLKTNTSVLTNALTNLLDPNYKIPAQWKYNLSINWRPDLEGTVLGRGWSIRADALFSDTQQAPRWTDLRAQPLVVGGVTQVTPDGRVRYGGNVNGSAPGANYDMMLTNTDRGISRVFALGLNKEGKVIDASVAYTHTTMKDVAGLLATSTVSSTYGVPTDSANAGGAYGRSSFEITHIIRGTLNFHKKIFGDNETRFGINWEHRTGQPYSITMNDFFTNSATGRGGVFGTALNTTSHLFYVPNFNAGASSTNALQYGNVIFADQATLDAVKNLVQNTKLGKYQGQIAPKNILTGPSYEKVDLNFSQQIPFVRHTKFTALFSIENFLNLVNRNWGTYQDFGGSASVVRVQCSGTTSDGQTCANYIYSTFSQPKTTAYSKPSLYAIRAGVRFDF